MRGIAMPVATVECPSPPATNKSLWATVRDEQAPLANRALAMSELAAVGDENLGSFLADELRKPSALEWLAEVVFTAETALVNQAANTLVNSIIEKFLDTGEAQWQAVVESAIRQVGGSLTADQLPRSLGFKSDGFADHAFSLLYVLLDDP